MTDRDAMAEVARTADRGAIAVIDGDAVPAEEMARLARAFAHFGRQVVVVSERYPDLAGARLAPNMTDLEMRWGELVYGGLGSISVSPVRVDGVDRSAQSRAFTDAVENVVFGAALDRANRMHRYRVTGQNVLANLEHMQRPTLMEADGCYSGIPAFIVGAGPSLDTDKHHIAAMKKRGLVIAVNGAGQQLPEAPHITLSVECEDTRPLIGDTRDSVVAACLSAHPSMFDYLGATPLWTCPASSVATAMVERPHLRTIISASCGALELALRFGCSPIILLGQDLGWPGDKLYCDGIGGRLVDKDTPQWGETHTGLKRSTGPLPTRFDSIEVPAIGGGSVRTNKQFHHLIRWLGQMAHHGWVQGVNAGSTGALLPNWAHMPLTGALEHMSLRDVPHPRDVLDSMPRRPPEAVEQFVRDVYADMGFAQDKAAEIQRLAHHELGSPTRTMRIRDVATQIRRTSPVLWYLASDGMVAAADRWLGEPPSSDSDQEYSAELNHIIAICDEVMNAHPSPR